MLGRLKQKQTHFLPINNIMTNLKKFIEKVSFIEGNNTKTMVLSIMEAKAIRNELSKLLLDYASLVDKPKSQEVIEVKISGGSFK
jgi:hypothetical protein